MFKPAGPNKVFSCLMIFFVIIPLLAGGCRSLTPDQKSAKQAQVEAKKSRYQNLLTALRDQTLPKGQEAAKVRETFGEPDDVFSSGSSVSSMEIWTYEKITSHEEETWEPIKLYFNDGLLISAKY